MSSVLLTDILAKFDDVAFDSREIVRGGSGRRFFRIGLPDGESAILCLYDGTRAENALAAGIAEFLGVKLGLPVPRVLDHDPARMALLFEDLGTEELWNLRDECPELKLAAYGDALKSLAKLHSKESYATFLLSDVKLMEGFGPELYKWERDYFRDNAIARILGELDATRLEALEVELAALAARLDALPRTLVHRDCQSQNILMRDGRAHFIDFQGLRTGTGFYDLGSLLFDPYVEFTQSERARLLGDYAEAAGVPRDAKFIAAFLDASAQRLMQALGAYHFLGHTKGRTEFLKYVRPALGHLMLATRDNAALPKLREIVEQMYVRHLVESGEVKV